MLRTTIGEMYNQEIKQWEKDCFFAASFVMQFPMARPSIGT